MPAGASVPVPRIAASDLEALLAGAPAGLWVLDTRPAEAFEEGHVPGSLHCPVHDLSRRERELPSKGETVVVVGEAGSRGRASAVFLYLAWFAGVVLLEGGFPAWRGPVEKGPGRPLSDARPAKPPGWVDPPS